MSRTPVRGSALEKRSSTRKTANNSGGRDVEEMQAGNTEAETDCSQNRTEVSQSSTVKFGHVSYVEFESQARQLCCLLWPATVDEVAEISFLKRVQQRLSDALRYKEPSSSITATQCSKKLAFEYLRGGSFNRVIGITATEEDGTESQMVLRVARGCWADPEHDVTILKFIQKHAMFDSIPTPEVIAYDFSSNNPMDAPYVMQRRIPGLDLESKARSYPDLTHDQKKSFVEQYCQMLLDLYSIENPYAGRIDARTDDEGKQIFTVGPFPCNSNIDAFAADWVEHHPFFQTLDFEAHETIADDISISSYGKPEHQTVRHFFDTQFGRWKLESLMANPQTVREISLVDDLARMAHEMDVFGLFIPMDENEIHPYCLTHFDLDPRNIMLDIQDDGYPKITGVLDWDLAMFAPKWVHCRPPMWIWNWLDGGNEDQKKANDEPPTEEQRELKKLYEECMGDDFNSYAFYLPYRLARSLYRIAVTGIQANYGIATSLVEEWDEWYAEELRRRAEEAEKSKKAEAEGDKGTKDKEYESDDQDKNGGTADSST